MGDAQGLQKCPDRTLAHERQEDRGKTNDDDGFGKAGGPRLPLLCCLFSRLWSVGRLVGDIDKRCENREPGVDRENDFCDRLHALRIDNARNGGLRVDQIRNQLKADDHHQRHAPGEDAEVLCRRF